MTENPHSNRQKKKKSEDVSMLSDSDSDSDSSMVDDDDDDEEHPVAKRRRIYHVIDPDLQATDVRRPAISQFSDLDFVKEKLSKFRDFNKKHYGTDRITPQDMLLLEQLFAKYGPEEQQKLYDALIDQEQEMVDSILDEDQQLSDKYYGDTAALIRTYGDAPINVGEMIKWIALCQRYSNDRIELAESYDSDEMILRSDLVFLSTYTAGNPELAMKFTETLFDHEYLCIAVKVGVKHAVHFRKVPSGIGDETYSGEHSIVLFIDKENKTIKIFDSSQYFNENNFSTLLFALLAPIFTSRSHDLDKAVRMSEKNIMLATYIIHILFQIDKPSEFYSLPDKEPKARRLEFEDIINRAIAAGWDFKSIRYKPQFVFQAPHRLDELLGNGYCGTYSAWVCWLCTLNPVNVFLIDAVTEPPANNIKALAAYIRKCIAQGRITIPINITNYKLSKL